jgi:hypothetical protein
MAPNSPSELMPSAILRVDRPMPNFFVPFFAHGRVRPTHPHKRITREFEDYPVPTGAGVGDFVPLAYISCGYATFISAQRAGP